MAYFVIIFTFAQGVNKKLLHVEEYILERDLSVQSLQLDGHFWTTNSRPVLGEEEVEKKNLNEKNSEQPECKIYWCDDMRANDVWCRLGQNP